MQLPTAVAFIDIPKLMRNKAGVAALVPLCLRNCCHLCCAVVSWRNCVVCRRVPSARRQLDSHFDMTRRRGEEEVLELFVVLNRFVNVRAQFSRHYIVQLPPRRLSFQAFL